MYLNIFKDLSNVWTFLGTYWWYFLVGIGVALLIIILWAIISKGTPNKIICLLLVILCFAGSIGVAVMVDKNKKIIYADGFPTETLPNGSTVVDGDLYWDPTGNHGYTNAEIDAAENDPNCPTHDDKYLKIRITDYMDIVIYSYEKNIDNKTYTMNVMFDKTTSGLVFTGCFNVGLKQTGMLWWYKVYFVNEMSLGDNFSPALFPIIESNGATTLFLKPEVFVPGFYSMTHKVFVRALFHNDSTILWYPYLYQNEAFSIAANGCGDIYRNDFMLFEPFDIKTTKGSVETDLNAFYTSVFNSTQNIGQNCDVDVTRLVCDIDDDNVIYKGNRFISVEYHDFSYKYAFGFSADMPSQDKLKEDKLPIESDIPTVDAMPFVNISCLQTNTTAMDDLSNDIVKTIVTLKNKEDVTKVYTFTFDTLDKLKLGVTEKMPFGTYTLTVNSRYLNFETNVAEITIGKGSTSFILKYQYTGEYTAFKVKVVNSETIDGSISIFFENKIDSNITYSFVFTGTTFDVEKVMRYGIYKYQIVASDGYVFDKTSGEIDITTSTEKEMRLTYTKRTNVGDLNFGISIQNCTSIRDFSLNATSGVVDIVRSKLGGNKVYNVLIKFYDVDGKNIEQFSHTHSGSGTCFDEWDTTTLINGANYTIQLSFVDASDITKIYVSDVIANFIYNNSQNYQITYIASIIA